MQVGAVDTMVGELLDHLAAADVGADAARGHLGPRHQPHPPGHRQDASPPTTRRRCTGCRCSSRRRDRCQGEVRDDSAQGIDVLPSIVDLLDADVDWSFDGHSLYDGSAATPSRECRPTSPPCSTSPGGAARPSRTVTTGSPWRRSATTAISSVGTSTSSRSVRTATSATIDQAELEPTSRPTTARCPSPSPARSGVPTSRPSCSWRSTAARRRRRRLRPRWLPLDVHRLPRRSLPRRQQRRGDLRGHPRR